MNFADITGKEKSVIAEYFTENQWNELHDWEKNRNYITLKRYLAFKDYKGINLPPPDFMLERRRLTDVSDSKQSSDKKEGKTVTINGTPAGKEASQLKYDQIPSTSNENKDYYIQPQKKTSRKSIRTNSKDDTEAPPKKYPKRSMPVKNYHEPEEPKDDRYVYCDNCEEDYVDYCKICGKLSFLRDYPVRMNTSDRAKKTCPKGILVVRPSNIHGFGVFTLQAVPKGVQMGPYEGQAAKQETKSGYAWKLRNGKLIDAADERNSNYLRYVNCARNSDEQNLVAFQYDGKLFYRTCKNIEPGEELLVYYGHSFAKTLGIDPKRFYEPNTNKVKDYYTCQYCHIGLSTQQYRDIHQLRCRYSPGNMITFDVNQAVTCQHCCRLFENDEDLEKHENKCIHNKKIRKITALHSNREEMERFKCSECSYATNYACYLKQHRLIHSKEGRERFACPQCKHSTYHKNSLIRHISNIHSTNASKFCCEVCRKIFKSKKSLDYHILQQHPSLMDSVSSKVHECRVCQFKTTFTTDLSRHMLNHSKKNAPCFQCSTCQYKTYYKSNYNQHLKIHLEVKPLRCTECSEGFARKEGLDGHILNHHIDNVLLMESITTKIHSCQHCNYKAVNTTDLKRHSKKHEL